MTLVVLGDNLRTGVGAGWAKTSRLTGEKRFLFLFRVEGQRDPSADALHGGAKMRATPIPNILVSHLGERPSGFPWSPDRPMRRG